MREFKVGDKVRLISLDYEDEMNDIELGHSGVVERVEDDGLLLTDGNFFYFNQLEKVGEVNEHISEAIEILERPKPSEFIASTEDANSDTNNPDLINHPPHYTSAGMETIDKMEFFFGTKALKIYCTINAYKYDSRAGLKDDVQKDGEKSTWYINKANELQEKIDNGEGILGSLDYLLE